MPAPRWCSCDTDANTFTIDPAQIEAGITPRTVGIIPVHLYGQPADMDAIMAIAAKHKLWVIEDCAQSHLARYKGRTVGTLGTAAYSASIPERISARWATPAPSSPTTSSLPIAWACSRGTAAS